MEARAADMSFELVKPDQMVYLKVPGYGDKQTPSLAPYSERFIVDAPTVPPEYTESLFSWIKRQVNRIYLDFFEVAR